MVKFSHILCADWSKKVVKRAAYVGDLENRSIRRLTVDGGWSLQSLLSTAAHLERRCSDRYRRTFRSTGKFSYSCSKTARLECG